LGVRWKNLSDDYSLLAFKDPKRLKNSNPWLQKIYLRFHITILKWRFCRYRKRNYFGYRIYWFWRFIKNSEVEQVWNKVLKRCGFGIKPGSSSWHVAIGNGFLFVWKRHQWHYITPLEAGLGWITKFTKEFTNQKTWKQKRSWSY
jgi:aminomethyltransferase